MSLNIDTHESQNYVRAFACLLAGFRLDCQAVTRNAYAQTASEPYLEILGRQRLVYRMPGEALEDYRLRVLDAFELARGRGNLDSIKSAMTALGYTFNSFVSGNTDFGAGGYNLLLYANSAWARHDATYYHNRTIYHNAPSYNDLVIELIQAGGITPEQEAAIVNALSNILRASITIDHFNQLTPS